MLDFDDRVVTFIDILMLVQCLGVDVVMVRAGLVLVKAVVFVDGQLGATHRGRFAVVGVDLVNGLGRRRRVLEGGPRRRHLLDRRGEFLVRRRQIFDLQLVRRLVHNVAAQAGQPEAQDAGHQQDDHQKLAPNNDPEVVVRVRSV